MDNTTDNTANTANEAAVTEKKPRVVKHIDERIKDLREDIAALQAKLDKMIGERDSEELVSTLSKGDAISFEYGRADSKRVESGIILAAAVNDKGVRQFNVLVGEGLDSKTLLVAASAVILDTPATAAE